MSQKPQYCLYLLVCCASVRYKSFRKRFSWFGTDETELKKANNLPNLTQSTPTCFSEWRYPKRPWNISNVTACGVDHKTPAWESQYRSNIVEHFWSKSQSLNAKDKFSSSFFTYSCVDSHQSFWSRRNVDEMGDRGHLACFCGPSVCKDLARH